jgi:hypothetical protein
MTLKFVGRSASRDGIHHGRGRDQATKRHISSYHGLEFSAEREGDSLHIYQHGSDDGYGVRVSRR